MTGSAYVMDWEAIDDGLDEWFLGRTYHPRVCPSDAAYDDDLPPQPAAHFCDASACTPRAIVSEFLPLSDFCELINDNFKNEVLNPDDRDLHMDALDECQIRADDLDWLNWALANKFHSDLIVFGVANDVVEFAKV